MSFMNLETVKRELQEARKARIEAESAGCDLEQVIEQMRLRRSGIDLDLLWEMVREDIPLAPTAH